MSRQDDQAGQSEEATSRGLNRVMFRKLVVVAVLMFGFGYALIPVYRKICEVTGVNFLTPKDVTVEAPANTQIDKTRTITVEFDGNAQGPWRFRPTVASMQVHPGEMTQVTYEVVNTQPRNVDAQAIPSYAPLQSAAFFKKVECFCFTQQTLGPNQAKQMPVVFYIDPKLPKEVTTITLSYTFFEINGKAKTAG
ncbi:cytochrome c oxidase assembly protein [Herbaspirillum sp. RU 5E]|jgi:cytochrome c oxidase assembly protein subunit 11|uniref:Cytochrome c oxidase assembly protein CtaG n=3 Tax=Pseudomonadota TaxID=1224 RepID=A0A225SP28_9BURK|nr:MULTISPECIES: cytochrome c oxidase assembly protein [Herbaspirillum]MBW9333047.1 cytochrome c oxidase assembly protein [Herbaspirillum sp. RU 5E]MRT32031.1 cytochrome c oxidase assembly protein [Herbaspirillum sp. CAH-3]OWY32730.1 cytochrome c oxidase assembly protein [Herbaspirillum aquaticum]